MKQLAEDDSCRISQLCRDGSEYLYALSICPETPEDFIADRMVKIGFSKRKAYNIAFSACQAHFFGAWGFSCN